MGKKSKKAAPKKARRVTAISLKGTGHSFGT